MSAREMARLGEEARAEISIPLLPAQPNPVRQDTHPVTTWKLLTGTGREFVRVSPSNLKVFIQ